MNPTATTHQRRPSVAVLVVAVLVALGALFAPAASASTGVGPETRVRAFDHPTAALVGRVGLGSSTAVGVSGPSLRQQASATGNATEAGAGVADDVAGRLPWNSYAEYPKVSVGGREYAQIGDRLYTQHAVDRMMPSGLGSSGAPGGAFGAGRSISPNFVEDVIRTGSSTTEIVDGVTRTIFRSGTVTVVTEDGGRLVVTVMTH